MLILDEKRSEQKDRKLRSFEQRINLEITKTQIGANTLALLDRLRVYVM